jgi:hypothetical protein
MALIRCALVACFLVVPCAAATACGSIHPAPSLGLEEAGALFEGVSKPFRLKGDAGLPEVVRPDGPKANVAATAICRGRSPRSTTCGGWPIRLFSAR